ncbi:MAG: non-canonical purine NTP diphosphatase [Bacteroidales bacterium]|nr:non-canonical purine NTP diphosphatase [Bacteroidales bacterium]
MDLVFATNNLHKISEINKLLKQHLHNENDLYKILSLEDIKCFEDIQETSNTLEGNASEKSRYIYNKYKINCFADDTGLEIEALDGKPGVYSARYAGDERSFERNMNKVLRELQGKTNRKARFRTVISLIIDGKEKLFEGIVNGIIIDEKRGEKGFGYDPIFQAEGYNISFAEMSLVEKNKISHRGIATRKLIDYLLKS